MKYKGYTIEKETEPWAIKSKGFYRYGDDEKLRHAETIEEAKYEIDELTESHDLTEEEYYIKHQFNG